MRLNSWLLCAHWKCVYCAIRAYSSIECILITSFEQIFFFFIHVHFNFIFFFSFVVVIAATNIWNSINYSGFVFLLVSSLWIIERKQTLISSNRFGFACHNHIETNDWKIGFHSILSRVKANEANPNDCIYIDAVHSIMYDYNCCLFLGLFK